MDYTVAYHDKAQSSTGEGTLVIVDGQGNIKEVRLGDYEGTHLSLGRETGNDVVIADKVVSGRHASIQIKDGNVYYSDMGSTNGTYLEQSGDVTYLYQDSSYVMLVSGSALRIQGRGMAAPSVLILFCNSEEEGAFFQYDASHSSGEVTIGRDGTNQIVLSHPGVSRRHATIRMGGDGGYELVDDNSRNGVLVNGKPLHGVCGLVDKDVIQILTSILIFADGVVHYRTETSGMDLRASNVSKTVGRDGKKILDGVSCHIHSNEFVAVIGSSGAGKTTFMNVVNGFDKKVEGKVSYNGRDVRTCFASLKGMVGYVPQQDIVYENLTLERMLYFTAKLKMPDDTDAKEIQDRIRTVLEMVELSRHRGTYIKKLSGGQKKRASIAVELLADPKLFFLDEPTSGLDPGTEKNLMATLGRLSKTQGKTIIVITHTVQNLHLCDKVMVLGVGGKLCFFGGIEQAKSFFKTDDVVDIYNMTVEAPDYWAGQFERSREDVKVQRNGELQQDKRRREELMAREENKTSPIRQLWFLTLRYLELIKNDGLRIFLLLFQPFAISLLLGVVAGEDVFSTYEKTKSILFSFCCAGIWIGLFNSIQEICKERDIVKREYMSNVRLGAYIASKFLVQGLLALVQALIMEGVFVWLVGEPERGLWNDNPYWETLLFIWLTIMAAMSLGLVVSAFMKSGDRAMAVAPFLLIVQLLFSGILFELDGMAEKISLVTISKWSVESFGSIANLNVLDLEMQKEFPQIVHEAEKAFEHTKEHLAINMEVLIMIMVFCAIVSTMKLRSLSNEGR